MDAHPTETFDQRVDWALIACLGVAIAPWFSGGQEAIAGLLGSVAMAVAAYLIWRRGTGASRVPRSVRWAYISFTGWSALSLIWTVNRFSTITWLLPVLLAGLVFLVTRTLSGSIKGKERVVRLYLSVALGFSLYGLWLYLTGNYQRFTSSYYWANPAAAYLIPAILVSLHKAMKKDARKWLWVSISSVFTASFFLTDSRAALFVLLISCVALLFISKPSVRQWGTFVLAIFLSIIVSTLFVQLRHLNQPKAVVSVPGARLTEATSGGSQSRSDRLNYIESTLQIAQRYPLVGTGAGTFGDVHPRYQKRVVSASLNAHNIFAQTLSELGIVGFIIVIWLTVAVFASAYRSGRENPELAVFAIALAALVLHAALDIDASYPSFLMLIAVLAGFVTQHHEVALRVRGFVPILALLLVVPYALWYEADAQALRAQAYQQISDYAKAAELYSGTSKFVIFNPDWLSAAGINRLTLASSGASGSPVTARDGLADARAAERLDPSDGQHWQLQARLMALLGDLSGAEAAARNALTLDPYNHPDYALDLAQIYLYENRSVDALSTARAALALYPDSVVANRSADATLRPTLANLAALIGNEHLKAGNTPEARSYAMLALHYNPSSTKGRGLQHRLEQVVAQP